MKNGKGYFKVTTTVIVQANNVRHAAHIAQGMAQSDNITINEYTVEDRSSAFGPTYKVDLSVKDAWQDGYCDQL